MRFLLALMLVAAAARAYAQDAPPLQERMMRPVDLDVRSMDVVDVIKFLGQKGSFNVVTGPAVGGKTTLLLHGVSVGQALKTICSLNRLAYYMDKDAVNIVSAAQYQSMFGKPFNDTTETVTIHLQYSRPASMLAALDGIRSNIGKIIIDEDTGSVVLIDTPQAIAAMTRAVAQIEQPLDNISFPLKYAKAATVVEKIRPRIDAKAVGTISADERSNRVIARVFPGRRAEVEQMVQALDKPGKEVMIIVRALQVTLKPGFNTAIDWEALVRNSMGKEKADLHLALPNTNLSSSFGQIGTGDIDFNDLAAAAQALREVSQSKILSSPQIMVANNEEAKIHVGDTVPYIVTTSTGSGTSAFLAESPRFVDTGLILNVTPVISSNGMVSMRVRPEFASIVARIPSLQGGGIPQVNKTEVETSVMVMDGATVIMAGLRGEEKTHVKKGIPGLMNVPYAGALFTSTDDSITSTETLILITPHIVEGTDDFSKVNGTLKPVKKYSDTVLKP